MKLYPGNESEKPVIRQVIKELKERNQISGRTVQVADKGLNCANNIISALKNKDGYLFSKIGKAAPRNRKGVGPFKERLQKTSLTAMVRYSTRLRNASMNFPIPIQTKMGRNIRKAEGKRVVTYNPSWQRKRNMR